MPSVSECSNPVRVGYPISQLGNGGAAFGTLACFVRERGGNRQICLLSNQHILHYYQDTSWISYAFPIQHVFDALDVEFPLEEAATATGSGPFKVHDLPLF